MKLSVVITTRNEESNIANCIRSFDRYRSDIEIIVVDNSSTDRTQEIAASLGARVLDKGPERCAQRNLGWQSANARWVLILDADMELPPETTGEILQIVSSSEPDPSAPLAYWVPEVRSGSGLRTKARNFERSFYDATCIDALRLFHKSGLEKVNGYDENLIAGGEDWELDIRIQEAGTKCAILKNHLVHNEKTLSFSRLMAKKAYYAKGVADYKAKWPNHPSVKKQFSPWYRYVGVFVENGKWRRLLRHPVLAATMYVERFMVGLVYIASLIRK